MAYINMLGVTKANHGKLNQDIRLLRRESNVDSHKTGLLTTQL